MEAQVTKYPRWLVATIFLTLAAALPILFASNADAGVFELSGGFMYNITTYGPGSYSWTRRFTAAFAYYLTEKSSIELSFQDVTTRNNILNEEDTTFYDKIYSVDWVQHLTGKDAPVQPYIKVGVGQLNRSSDGYYVGGGAPPAEYDSFTSIFGLGLKVYITKSFALRAEGTTYLTDLQFGSWKDNAGATAGISIFF